MSSSIDTIRSPYIRSRTSVTASQNSVARPRTARRPTETYPRSGFEPLIVAAKPIHPLLLTGNNRSLKNKSRQIKPPSSAPPRIHFPHSSDRRSQITLSDLSNDDDDDLPISFTPSPNLQNVKEDEENTNDDEILSIDQKPVSNISLKSTIKLKGQVPRCRSANDNKQSYLVNRTYPRFILITDQEHRIESWYHQYPFIVSDDLIQAFQSKPTKSTVSAYFIDDQQQSTNFNLNKKTYLQGKSFHINNDWKKYDLIFISKNIYQQIIIHLQPIIKLSGKLIHIYQLNHDEDLKTQVRYTWKQLNQQALSNI